MEWDGGEASPSPLLPMAQWPRTKGRKVRFTPRRIEGSDEDLPPPRIEEDQSTSRQGDAAAEPPETPPTVEGRKAVTDATPAEGQPESTSPGASVFRRLGHRTHRDFSPSPVRFPSFRGSITRGILFGGLRSIPTDARDPPHGSCFNCRKGGHTRFDCREPPTLFCFNCGRWGTNLRECPRCGEAHLEYRRGPAERQAVPRRKREVAQTPMPSRDRPLHCDTKPGEAGSKTARIPEKGAGQLGSQRGHGKRRQTPSRGEQRQRGNNKNRRRHRQRGDYPTA